MTSSTLDKPTLILPPHAKDATRPEPTRGHEMFGGVESRRHSVVLAVPGKQFDWSTASAVMQSSLDRHDVTIRNRGTGNSADDMNVLWCDALHRASQCEITHFAMIHSDVIAPPGWLDELLEEMDRLNADVVSAVLPIKDCRGLTTTGIGSHADPWHPKRRFTIRELAKMPETFGLGEHAPADEYLLFNTGCWVARLDNERWLTRRDDGTLLAEFRFPISIHCDGDGRLTPRRESEDWYFSRMCGVLGMRCYATSKLPLYHVGPMPHPSFGEWGEWEHDQETAEKWAAEEKE